MQISARTGIEIRNLGELKMFAELVCATDFVPRGTTVPKAMVAIQYGYEVGLTPMQALQNVSVINGKPSVWGDAMPGLVMASGLLEDIHEDFQGTGDDFSAVCTVKRRGVSSPVTRKFSVKMAKRANLYGKQGPWTQYTSRMLQMRARSFCLRDAFPDVLRGMIAVEEAMDYPTRDVKATVRVDEVFAPPRPRSHDRDLTPHEEGLPNPFIRTEEDPEPYPVAEVPETPQEEEALTGQVPAAGIWDAPEKGDMTVVSSENPEKKPQLGAFFDDIKAYLTELKKYGRVYPELDLAAVSLSDDKEQEQILLKLQKDYEAAMKDIK
jgi:hypothetical protein